MEATKTTQFLLTGVLEKLKIGTKQKLKDLGFLNAYLGDNSHHVQYKDCIYLLFNTKEPILLQEFIDVWCGEEVAGVYDYEGGYTMVVILYPAKWIRVYKLFIEGKYSQFPREYKEMFDKKPNLEEKTLYKSHPAFTRCSSSLVWLIFTKSPMLREWVEEQVDESLPANSELWDIPNMDNEIFNYSKIQKQKENVHK
jgi:hypothetical protein